MILVPVYLSLCHCLQMVNKTKHTPAEEHMHGNEFIAGDRMLACQFLGPCIVLVY